MNQFYIYNMCIYICISESKRSIERSIERWRLQRCFFGLFFGDEETKGRASSQKRTKEAWPVHKCMMNIRASRTQDVFLAAVIKID